ncbi:MAG: FAD-dependent oxidoreductase, partial [Actinomycetes bacterium]
MVAVVVLGGGPGGYEAALVAAQQGAEVTLIEDVGLGGAAVLTDCVPSKALVAIARSGSLAAQSGDLGVRIQGQPINPRHVGVDLDVVDQRIEELASAQSRDIEARLVRDGVKVLHGHGELAADAFVDVTSGEAAGAHVPYDLLLIATGASPRELPEAQTDGERILNWKQVWNLTQMPERLVVVGSGVTGAE